MLTIFKRSNRNKLDPADDPLAIRDLLEHPQLRKAMGLDDVGELDVRRPARRRHAVPGGRVIMMPQPAVRAGNAPRRVLEGAA